MFHNIIYYLPTFRLECCIRKHSRDDVCHDNDFQAHSSVEKASLIGLVKLRLLESDDKLSLRGDVLLTAINEDRDAGLIPFYVRIRLSPYNGRVLLHVNKHNMPMPYWVIQTGVVSYNEKCLSRHLCISYFSETKRISVMNI